MKRTVVALLSLVVAVSVIGCDDTESDATDAAISEADAAVGEGGAGGAGGGEGGAGGGVGGAGGGEGGMGGAGGAGGMGGEGGMGGGEAPDGEALFLSSCSACHGPEGDGTVTAPQIQSPVWGYATFVVRNGRSDMPNFAAAMPAYDEAALTAEELDAVLAYLGDAPAPANGEGLYTRYCGNCHGPDARGGRTGRNLLGEDLGDFTSLIRRGHGGANYGLAGSYMPAWDDTEITADEIELIHTYVSGL
jgi:mono/diheme cytochrome c family protein